MSLILPKGWVAERFSLGHMSFTYGLCQVSLYEKSPSIVETDLDFTFGINKKQPPKPRQGSHKGIKSTEYLGESKDLNGKPLTLYVGIFETNRPVVIKWNEDAKFLPQLRSIISSVRLLKSSEDT